MKFPNDKKQLPVPRIDPDVKAMNGKSTKRLDKCIQELTDLLDEQEARHEKGSDCPVSRPDSE